MKRLTKIRNEKMISGVCAGLGDYFDLDPTIIRVGYVLASMMIAGFPGLVLYIILAIVMPER